MLKGQRGGVGGRPGSDSGTSRDPLAAGRHSVPQVLRELRSPAGWAGEGPSPHPPRRSHHLQVGFPCAPYCKS